MGPVRIPNFRFAAIKPKKIKPANDKILITVSTVCKILEFSLTIVTQQNNRENKETI
jgi:hypothetical protein